MSVLVSTAPASFLFCFQPGMAAMHARRGPAFLQNVARCKTSPVRPASVVYQKIATAHSIPGAPPRLNFHSRLLYY